MRIGIIGTGGVGGYFGGRMASAGYDVTFVARGEHLRAMQTKGLKVKSILGDFEVRKVNASDNFNDLADADLIFISVKAWQVIDIAKELKPILHNNSTVIPLQNGVLAADELLEFLNPVNVVGGLCRIISKIDAPGVINHFGIEPTIIFGELNNQRTERILKIKEILDKSGITSIAAENIQAEVWKKFIGICVSGLLAITRSTYGELRAIKETKELMYRIMSEIYEVSVKAGIMINSDFVNNYMNVILTTFPYESTSSLSRDVIEGKPSEIEYQNGTVVKLAEKYGVEVPVNKFIYSCILPMENKARNK